MALSPEQLQAMMSMAPTPDASAGALGHSNNTLLSGIGNTIGGAYSAFSNTMGDLSTGVAKGELSTLQGMGTLGQTIGNQTAGRVANAIGGKGFTPTQGGLNIGAQTQPQAQQPDIFTQGSQPAQQAQQALKPAGITQSIGYSGEKVGEFLAPGGAEKGVFEKGASLIDRIPEALGMTGKMAGAITGSLKTALQGLISGTSMGGITALQTGGDTSAVQSSAELGGIAGGLTGALRAFGPDLAHMLNKADFKLSPQAEAKTAKIADNASRFITDNKIAGSNPTKYTQLNSLNQNLESTLQSSLPKDVQVPKADIINDITTRIESLKTKDPAIYNQAKNKADEAIAMLRSQSGDSIAVQDALSGKRSFGQLAFKTSQAAKRDPLVSSEGAYAVEQGYQNALTNTLEKSNSPITIPSSLQKYFGGQPQVSLPDFNKVYSNAINAKNLTYLAQFKKDTGLFGRLFGLWAGESVGQMVMPGLGGKLVGGAVGEISSTHLPGLVRNVGERVAENPEVANTAAKVYQGITSNSTPNIP